jgi:hypothetical protein
MIEVVSNMDSHDILQVKMSTEFLDEKYKNAER